MSLLGNLRINNFRNIEELKIKVTSSMVCIYGDNAQGKTNIVEAIYLLGNSKSFRNVTLVDVLKFNEKNSFVSAEFKDEDGTFDVSYSFDKEKKTYNFNSNTLSSIKNIYSKLRIVAYTPASYLLILGNENERRLFFDRVAFSINKQHLENLINYNKIIKNRNIMIKQNKKFYILDGILAELNEKIICARIKAVEEIEKIVQNIFVSFFVDVNNLKIRYKSSCGFKKEEILENIKKNKDKDICCACTTIGSHRDIFDIKIDDVNAKKIISTGQNKLLSLLLKLAKIEIIKKYSDINPIFIFDDAGAFLDKDKFLQLADYIKKIKVQIFFTSVDKSLFENDLFDSVQLLKVEKGELKNV